MAIPILPDTIPLEEAEVLTTNWRNFIAAATSQDNYIRAFYIPITDIVQLAKFHNVEAVRAYLSLVDPNDSSTTKIVLVPVDDQNNDIISVPNLDEEVSSIYDFTKPCPQACDINSPLFNDDQP